MKLRDVTLGSAFFLLFFENLAWAETLWVECFSHRGGYAASFEATDTQGTRLAPLWNEIHLLQNNRAMDSLWLRQWPLLPNPRDIDHVYLNRAGDKRITVRSVSNPAGFLWKLEIAGNTEVNFQDSECHTYRR